MRTWFRILGYLKPYWRSLILVYVALILGVGFQLAIPIVLGRAIDDGVIGGDQAFLIQAAGIILGLAVLQAIFTFIRSYGTNRVAEQIGYDLRNELFDKFQHLPFQFYDRAQTGQLMSRATDDINQIRGMLMFSIRAIVQAIGMLAIITFLLFQEHWLLALVALSTTPFLMFWAVRFGVSIRPMFLQVQRQFGIMTSTLQENVAGGRVVRAFAQENAESDRFESELEELFTRNIRASNRWSFNLPLTLGMNGLSVAGVVWVGGYMVLTGQISVGTLVVFERYTTMLQEPVRWLGFVVQRIARSIASGERIFEIMDTKPAITDSPDATPFPDMQGVVEFDHVSFRFRGGKTEALHDISFTARPGEFIALVGPTGAGKSSVTSLIPRFYDVTEGAVRIDGRDVRDITLDSLRSQIGIVMQESFLFSMTVAENISYGRPDATREEVIAAAKAADAHDFVLRMEEGYDTVIGERGVTLSGGQKQRLSIARAIVLNPRILILDDATASVDAETEHDIHQALRKLMAERTSFVIAQRLTTVRDADRIIVFEEGRITQSGTHDELVAEERGFYRELYDLQMRDQEEASLLDPGGTIPETVEQPVPDGAGPTDDTALNRERQGTQGEDATRDGVPLDRDTQPANTASEPEDAAEAESRTATSGTGTQRGTN